MGRMRLIRPIGHRPPSFRRRPMTVTETAMQRLSRMPGAAALAALLLVASPLLSAPPKEVNKLHVLLVFDTQDDLLSDSLEIDEQRVLGFLNSTIPANRLSVTVLKGENVTPERILDHYRKAKPSTEDGLLFFYGGHGATDPVKKHYFQL